MADQKYILDGHDLVPVDLMTWALWFEQGDKRIVAKTEVRPGIEVSTVFIGLDMSFGLGGPPLLFETMVFSDYGGDDEIRYATWDEAQAGHDAIVKRLSAQLSEAPKIPSSDRA